jgi:hypothetical protein
VGCIFNSVGLIITREIPSIKSCHVFSDVGNANVARCDDNSVVDSSHGRTRLF